MPEQEQTILSGQRQYLAIHANSTVYGVVGIMIQKQPLDAFENSAHCPYWENVPLRWRMIKCPGKGGGCDSGKE